MAIDKTFNKKWLLSLPDDPPEKRTEYRDTQYKYLRAVVQPTGHVSLSCYKCPRGHQSAKRRVLDVRVDQYMPPMSEVRSLCADKAKEIDAGEVERGQVLTLDDGFKVMLESAAIKQRTITEYTRYVNVHLKAWRYKPLTGDPGTIVNKHRAIARSTGPVAANCAMKLYRRVLKVCKAQRFNVPDWPTEQIKVLKMWAEETPRTKRRLERQDFPAVWTAIDSLEPKSRDFMKFLLLTGCRRNEARDLEASAVNFKRSTVTFFDTKNGTDHTLPLTDTLTDILKRRKRAAGQDGKLFPGVQPPTITRKIELATGVHLTPHDCRRTFAGVAELAGIGSHTTSVILNHKPQGVTALYIGVLDHEALRRSLKKIEQQMLDLACG